MIAGALVIAIVAGALFTLRQQPVTADEIVAKAGSKIKDLSSYHYRYKTTLYQPNGKEYVAHYEIWYKASDKMKLVLTQPGSTMVNITKGNAKWTYNKGNNVAFVTPVFDKELEFNRNTGRFTSGGTDAAKELGAGYKYVGTERIGKRECDVIEGDFPDDQHIRACIDRSTGFLLQFIETKKGKPSQKTDVEILDVDKLISDDIFETRLPLGTLLVKMPAMTNELFNVNLHPDPKSRDFTGRVQEPYEVTSELSILSEQGVASNAELKKMYTPGYIPQGYKLVGVGSEGKRYKNQDGSVGVNFSGAYDTIHIDYINTKTGDTMVMMESADKFKESEVRNISTNGFQGRVKTYKVPFPYIEVFWEQDGTYFSLTASSLDEQEVVKIAQSMHEFVPAKD